jgi:hypothetical protein
VPPQEPEGTEPGGRAQRRLPEQCRARPPTGSAAQLAAEFNAENLRLIEVMEQLSPDQWRLRGANAPGYNYGEDERRTVAQIALHTANQHLVQMAIVRAIVEGRSEPLQGVPTNEEAVGNPDPEPAELLRRLRENGAAAAAAILDLAEAELDRALTFRGFTMTAAQAVEQLQIGHVRWHRTSIEATVTTG